MDPILLELYRHRLTGVAEEMGITLQRTAFSPNIKERLDFSCALFDADGQMVAQAAHIPVHLGAMPASVGSALDAFDTWKPGDIVLLNDPYAGGTHLPDITMISPVFAPEQVHDRPAFYVASRAHHADIGGMTPGSLPLSNELYQEGLILPPVKLYNKGHLNEALLQVILRNVRTPDEREGDLNAQRAAHTVGERRLHELMDSFGLEEVASYARHLQHYSERLMRATIATWPDGIYEFEDVLIHDGDATLQQIPIRVAAQVKEDTLVFNFTGTSPSTFNSLNAVLSITQSACYYVACCLAGEEIPVNAGCFLPIRVEAPLGCLVHAQPQAAVAGGNVETSQRIVDVVLGALSQALPTHIPAASQGTMNNLTIGGLRNDGTSFAYYETLAGGMGAAPDGEGLDGVHVHMSNTLNTPVEALEMAFPFRIEQYAFRQGSGGTGKHRGGNGIIREYTFLSPATVTMLSARRHSAPWGLEGGLPGQPGRNLLRTKGGEEVLLPAMFTRQFEAGELLRIETPGGGGFGERVK